MSNATNVKLKPCPECGGEAEYNSMQFLNGPDKCYVQCTKCGFRTGYFETKWPAIDLWNTVADRWATSGSCGTLEQEARG